jgi:outer membrane protein TolC
MLAMLAGCSRAHYRDATDVDAYSLLAEKSVGRPWQVPGGFNIMPNPLSRFFDPTCPEDPLLPAPAPQLYAYQLPVLPSQTNAADNSIRRLPPCSPQLSASLGQMVGGPASRGGTAPGVGEVSAGNVQVVSYLSPADRVRLIALAANTTLAASGPGGACADDELPIPPVAAKNWNQIPRMAVTRILEFDSIRSEYRLTFNSDPPEELLDSSQRLTLEDIVYLASINNREYQTQKETLYRTALNLSLERFRFLLKFSTTGNGADVNYEHSGVDGISQSRVTAPASLQVDKVLATGGDFVARFANNVVMTFNGPQGFAADVTSDVLFDFSQSLLQRDIRFESLTQSERDVVYAARDYARFRKALFVQLATQYYDLIRNYRQIEIAAQNYFQLVRSFSESEVSYETGQVSRFQTDQIEQQLLDGRRALVSVTNSLENSLDLLKIRIGLPTELRLNVDLEELDQLTLRDALAVANELIRRTRDDRLLREREKDPAVMKPDILLSASSVLLERMIRAKELRGQLGKQQVDVRPLHIRRAGIDTKLARTAVAQARAELADEEDNDKVSESKLQQATEALYQSLRHLVCRQLHLAGLAGADGGRVLELQRRLEEWNAEEVKLRNDPEIQREQKQNERVTEVLERARKLLASVEAISQDADRLLGVPAAPRAPEEEMAELLRETDALLAESGQLLQSTEEGLVPVDIDVDDAMLTALVLRLDLMNERGALADDWRRIKLAADDLRSVINFNASQFLSTRREWNQPFGDDTTDTNRTDVRLSFDAPLNRRAQRNAYRRSLINYQVALRGLMLAEDNIKLAVRQDLRSLTLDREQYAIDIASAALAYERVISTQQEIRLPFTNVRIFDFLEAQRDYVQALSTVASRHIDYILDRTQLFLDTELLTVDERGFWNELHDEKYQPEPYYQLPPYSMPAYGELPCGVWYSKEVKRMCQTPPGVSTVLQSPDQSAEGNRQSQPESIPTPEAVLQPPVPAQPNR